MMSSSQLAVGTSVEQASSRWADLIRAEYREMPGLSLTKPQIQRMWSLSPSTCDTLVDLLESEKFLERVAGAYILARS